jgi:Flp pilus assembly protein CpaB
VKKKSPPYAIIGAVVLGIIAIVAFAQWKKVQDQKAASAVAAEAAKRQQEIDQLKSRQQVTVTETPTNMRNVLYATQPVAAGAKISPAFFEKKQTPTDILPDAYTADSDIVGFYAIRKIEKGDPLTPRNIGKSLPYMSQRISPGMRAIALPVYNAEDNNTGGFVVDGDRVDLLYTPVVGDVKIRTQVLMQNLVVLYVPGPQIKTDKTDGIVPISPPGGPISVTFEVTPEQAEALVYFSASKNGQINMILRARRDTSEVKIKPFEGVDYVGNIGKVQRTTDKSIERVQELALKIEAEEKTQGSQGNTNETPTPTPPSP